MIRCLIIDDETLALDLLEDNIRQVPFLKLVCRCSTGLEAMAALKESEIDLVFLDIRMPDISGIQLLKVLKTRPMVILTTAYEHYALEGYDLDVVDYLLKPFSFERFLRAVNKAQELLVLRGKAATLPVQEEARPVDELLFVKAGYKQVKIVPANILYIEGLKDYIKIYEGDKPVITQMSLKAVEELLPPALFVRVHRSFIVNIRHITYIQRMHIRVGNKDIPLSENYRDQFFQFINKNKNT